MMSLSVSMCISVYVYICIAVVVSLYQMLQVISIDELS